MSNTNIFIISGPSGAGEDSIIEELGKKLPIERIITTTTRAMRPKEKEGCPYYFISKEKFNKKIKNNEFAEYAKQYNDNLYGVTNSELKRVSDSKKIALWKIDYKGVKTAKLKYPNIISIFINTESIEILENRIRKRDNVSEKYIKERMTYTKEWLKNTSIYDYIVINKEGKLNEAVEEIFNIIIKNSNFNV